MQNKNKSFRGGRPGPDSLQKTASKAAVLAFAAALAGCQTMPADPSATAAPSAALAPVEVPRFPFLTPVAEPASEAPDLLTRIREQLTLPSSEDPTVERERSWYGRHEDYLNRVFGRADRYLYHIVTELERREMPLDLALLPVVESAFDPFAYSHGRAAGLWQIIPGTGKRLGLDQNWWFDGRRDVIESTRAALDYLEYLHDMFDGDWLLAVAGYNSGEGNVARAVKRAREAGQPTDFWTIKRYLPAETRTYVPRLLAIRDLVRDAAELGLELPLIANAPHFEVVDLDGQIDMALAAELAGLERDDLYALNPGINRWATDPNGPHRLLVPIDKAPAFAVSLASLGERERVRWSRHKVQSGETLGKLAQQYHTTTDVLRQINGIRGNTIRAGDYLMIPHAMQSIPTYTQTADARAARTVATERNGERRTHVVRTGDSLWSIARRYNVNVRALASWNAMAPGDVLSVGRELVIWTAGTGSQVTAERVAATIPAGANEQIRRVNYVVRRGDSLSSIARRFRVTVQNITQWNKVSAERLLHPGQRLVMYVNVTEQST